jgi:hypothetical protein
LIFKFLENQKLRLLKQISLLLDSLKRMWEYVFSHTKGCSSWQVLGKLCGFIHYNVHYGMLLTLSYGTYYL